MTTASDFARIVLPPPPSGYSQDYTRRLNGRIEELIRTRAAVDQLVTSGGCDCLNLKTDFGAVGDGVVNDAANIQAALDASSAQRRRLWVPSGQYRCQARLFVNSYLDIAFARDAYFIKDVVTTSQQALLGQTDLNTKIASILMTDVQVRGIDRARSIGRPICLRGNDMTFDRFVVVGYDGDAAMFFGGDRVKIQAPTVLNPFSTDSTGPAGIRFAGGDGYVCRDGFVVSADDCYAITPGQSPATAFFNQDITNASLADSYGKSTDARIFVLTLSAASQDLTCSVKNCKVSNVVGESAGTAANVGCQDSVSFAYLGSFENNTVDGCTLSGGLTRNKPLITPTSGTTAPSQNAFKDVLFANNIFIGGLFTDAVVEIVGLVNGAKFEGNIIKASKKANPDFGTIHIVNPTNDVKFIGNTIEAHSGATPKGAYDGATTAINLSNNLTMLGNIIENCEGQVCKIGYLAGSIWKNNVFRKKSGGAAATALVLVNNSTNCTLEGNTYSGIETRWTMTNTAATTANTLNDAKFYGTGSPEGVVTAQIGAVYVDLASPTLPEWVKITNTGNTGWRSRALSLPVGGLKGTNAAYVVTVAIAEIPFDTIQRNNAQIITGTKFRLAYAMALMMNLDFRIAAAAGGNASITLQLYAGATLLSTLTEPISAVNGERITSTLVTDTLPVGQDITIRASCTKNLTLDLTTSSWWATGLAQ